MAQRGIPHITLTKNAMNNNEYRVYSRNIGRIIIGIVTITITFWSVVIFLLIKII